MIEILFSPLEQFEFTLISGKVLNEIGIYEKLAPLNKSHNLIDLEILLGDSIYRDYVEEKLDKYFNFLSGFSDLRIYGHKQSQTNLYEIIIKDSLKNELIEGGPLYKNLDFFYTIDEGEEFAKIYTQVFNVDKLIYGTDLDYLIFINNVLDFNTLKTELPALSIVVARKLNDLVILNPTLYYLTYNLLGWISDSIVLNDMTLPMFEYLTTDYIDNVQGLTALEMNNRDYSAFSFYWLNIYNSLFIVIIIIGLIFIIFNNSRVSNIWQILNTLTFDFLLKSFISLANRNLLSFFPIFFCFFIFIYLLNLTALTPFSFCLTSNLWFSLSLSFSVWFGVTALAIIVRGGGFFTGFIPSNISSNELKSFITIIEVISYVARALSLGVRIFANMLAGHSLVHILSDLTATCFVEFENIGLKIFGIFPGIILSFILVIEFGICFLQGLVFVILTAIYLKEAFEGH